MMSKLYEFLELLYDQVGRGIYVWGGDGELLDDMDKPIAWIERHESKASDAKRAVSLYKKRLDKGIVNIRAFDCSGLVYWALHKLGLQKSDVSSRGLYGLCEDIKKSELRDGDLMFKHNGKRIVHVGVYANGQVIECKGRDYGVVISKITSSWNRFGRWKAFAEEPIVEPKIVYVKGKSVRVRKGGSTKYACIGIAHKGERYTYLGKADTGWYKIRFKGEEAYISNKSTLTALQ